MIRLRKFLFLQVILCYALVSVWIAPNIALATLESEKVLTPSVIPTQIINKKSLYAAGPSYDGVNTIGFFWPQLLSGFRDNVLWGDIGLWGALGIGIGYRHLLKPAFLNYQPCFGGLYFYVESPCYFPNLWLVPLLIRGYSTDQDIQKREFFWNYTKASVRFNGGFEIATPNVNLNLNMYGYANHTLPLDIDFIFDEKIASERIGYSLRLSLNNIKKSSRPFFEISYNAVSKWLADDDAASKGVGDDLLFDVTSNDRQEEWILTSALGMRHQMTDHWFVEFKGIRDWGHKWFNQYHCPIHFGFHYNASIIDHTLPQGYTQLPERFIPHYKNAEILRN